MKKVLHHWVLSNSKCYVIVCFMVLAIIAKANVAYSYTEEQPKSKTEQPSKLLKANNANSPITDVANTNATVQVSATAKSQMQQSLQEAFAKLNTRSSQFKIKEESASMIKALNVAANKDKINKLRKQADSTFKLLERMGQLIPFEKFSAGLMVELPIGLHQDLPGENTGVDIGFMNARLGPNAAYIMVFVRMQLPIKNPETGEPFQNLFFGADSLKISYDGNIVGDANLVLLGDVSIPFGKAVFTMKGGLDISTGTVNDSLTYVKLDCNRFKEVSVASELIFPRSMLVPIDYDGNVTSGYVRGKFAAVAQSLQNLLGKVSLGSFAVTGFENWGFRLNGAVLDFSESRNSYDVKFPAGYIQKNMPEGAEKAWKGVYINKFEVILPREFRERSQTNRISFGADSLLIDENGVTGKFYGKNILSIKKGDANGWKMSLDYVRIGFEANVCTGGLFNGRLVLPVTNVRPNGTSFDTTSTLAYNGMIQRGGNYSLVVRTVSQLNFDVWKARATLFPNSSVSLKVEDGVFKPTATLHGSLDIDYAQALSRANGDAESQAKKVDVNFKTITFRNLKLSTEAPYIEIEYLGYDGDIKVGGMPMTFSNIQAFTDGQNATISFGSNVNLMKNGFSVDGDIAIKGKLNTNTDAGHQWEFAGISVVVSGLDATIGPFRIKGQIRPFENNPCVPGKGYQASLTLTIKSPTKIEVSATAIFGNMPELGDNGRFWFVDASAELPNTVPPIGIFALNSIAGGAYHHMVPTKTACAGSASGVKYIFKQDVELGFKAVVGFSTKGVNAVDGMLGFEMVINKNFGVNSLGFFGEATIAGKFPVFDKLGGKLNSLNSKLRALSPTEAVAQSTPVSDKETTQTDLQKKSENEYAKTTTLTENVVLKNTIRAKIGILFDFENEILHADAQVFVNIGEGVIRGRGPSNRAGWMVMHFQKERPNQLGKWYVHVGSPTDPCGVSMGFGPLSVNTGMYLMIGHDIPPMPSPPSIIREMLGSSYRPLARPVCTTNGEGFVFGSNVNIDTGDLQILIFYTRVMAGLGFDFALTNNYLGTKVNGKQIGINGWYGTGQAYAYFDAAVGIKIKIWFAKIKVEIFRAGAGVLLEGGLPNPSYMSGYLAARYRALGGKVNGSFNLKIDLGDKPVNVNQSGDCKTKKI
ncbi:hypothetical protein [Arcicella rosea]|uniref:Ubiquinone biosynthesis protein UbiJ n=1 Tax=Arcicella rosea TaxID=502909 RepID=A0A841EP11_9BACT|nr:hypothetical protein [Arcicella rosea]MBB6005502.1 ubiquinone biosynthesis protein UbiJ [Arcicella rosea]